MRNQVRPSSIKAELGAIPQMSTNQVRLLDLLLTFFSVAKITKLLLPSLMMDLLLTLFLFPLRISTKRVMKTQLSLFRIPQHCSCHLSQMLSKLATATQLYRDSLMMIKPLTSFRQAVIILPVSNRATLF